MGKNLIIILVVLALGIFGYVAWDASRSLEEAGIKTPHLPKIKEKLTTNEKTLQHPINILLLGIDRRSRAETGYRTDIMILASLNPETNRITLVSIPRDLWYGGGRINALYIAQGWEPLQNAIEEFTGLRPERFILTDFKDFSWVVDAMGGVTVDVETTFTDVRYPVDATKTYQTINFTAGPEKMTGARALIFSRSRKGNNGEGSDWMRMKRQHLLLKGMVDAVQQPGSLFQPMVIEEAFKTVVENRMDTNLELKDVKYLWDFYKDKDKYEIYSFYLDYDYLYSPPLEQYGGAWVLVPKSGTYRQFHNAIHDKLFATEPEKPAQPSSETDL
ncbi:LCP family protein [Patescibacteria group bacterium]